MLPTVRHANSLSGLPRSRTRQFCFVAGQRVPARHRTPPGASKSAGLARLFCVRTLPGPFCRLRVPCRALPVPSRRLTLVTADPRAVLARWKAMDCRPRSRRASPGPGKGRPQRAGRIREPGDQTPPACHHATGPEAAQAANRTALWVGSRGPEPPAHNVRAPWADVQIVQPPSAQALLPARAD